MWQLKKQGENSACDKFEIEAERSLADSGVCQTRELVELGDLSTLKKQIAWLIVSVMIYVMCILGGDTV